MTPQNKQRGGIMGLIVALLIALGLWPIPAPTPIPPSPSPSPSSTVSVSPSPSLTPSPSPLPSALPTPELPWLCQLPPSTGSCVWPPAIASVFRHDIEDAQAMVGKEFFDIDGSIRNEHLYVLEVVRLLRTRGYCAIQGTTVADEAWVKNSNNFSEHWDLVSRDNIPITLYAARCEKAAF